MVYSGKVLLKVTTTMWKREPEVVVYIRAVGIKQRNQVRMGKEVIQF